MGASSDNEVKEAFTQMINEAKKKPLNVTPVLSSEILAVKHLVLTPQIIAFGGCYDR